MKKGKKKTGRPSKYSLAVIEKLCDRISTSTDGLHKICESDKSLPSFKVVFDWLNDMGRPEFRDMYARAREAQAELLADQIIEISNTPQIGRKTITKSTGVEITEGDMIEHRRLQVDARKWKASKLAPKKFGDKVDIDMTSGGKTMSTIVVLDEETKKMLESIK